MKTALLLSGGMDSLCVAWWKRPSVGITIDYGQLAAGAETISSRAVCEALGIEHHVLNVDCGLLGSGDMAGAPANTLAPASDWWPYRNQMLVTFASMKAISLGVQHVMLGTVRSDASHRDGTADFIDAMNRLLSLQEGSLTLSAPAITMSTVELVRMCGVPRELLSWAHSCHKTDVSCGACRGCNKYFEVWKELGKWNGPT